MSTLRPSSLWIPGLDLLDPTPHTVGTSDFATGPHLATCLYHRHGAKKNQKATFPVFTGCEKNPAEENRTSSASVDAMQVFV